ncbi:MAG: ribbon-helix-helix protein, CopG family [Acidimicrobiaceae bacterium]|nr:ribbon-helix-helix protein, CopG family [Acidimicrobiaceae bacterium]MDE0606204.1 ribbon-helix-helix protein, CopG family [Acidimicrobiaceae bacterium]
MRTTVELDDDTAKALAQLRNESGMGVSEAVNCLLRRGLLAETSPKPFVQQTRRLGIRIDVTNVAEAVDFLEGHQAR